MASIFASLMAPELAQRLQGIDLQALSRIAASRLSSRAVPNIGWIELVSSNDFDRVYKTLYVQQFSRRAERERSDLIVSRLAAQCAGDRQNLAPYRIIGIRDAVGGAIGAAHFSVLPLRRRNDGEMAVPYLQYIYVRPENRRQDMSEVLHTMTLAVAIADARTMGQGILEVPFTLFETEPPGDGEDEASRAFSATRAQVHTKGGAVAVVVFKDGVVISPHVQPGLKRGDPPLNLLWAVRPNPSFVRRWKIENVGRDLLVAYYQNLRDEGFPEDNIKLAENIVKERCAGGGWSLVPLDQVFPH